MQPGDKLNDRYEIVKELGEGAYGRVYLAHHVHLKEDVAIKMLHPSAGPPSEWPQLLQQFLNEARIVRQLDHPNIVKVKDYFEAHHTAFIAMEYLPGTTLEKEGKRGALPEPVVLEWVEQILCALEYLHSRPEGVVVRDLKPDNLMLSGGRVRIIDFGIAKVGAPSDGTYTIIRSRGTAGYCPLEQYDGGTSPRSDYYALGATMLRLLGNEIPPTAADRAQGWPLKDPRYVNSTVTDRTWGVIQRLMSLKKEDRPGSVQEIRRLLYQVDWQQFLQDVKSRGGFGSPWEERFVVECLSRVPVDFRHVEVQVPFTDGRGRPRYIDFGISEPSGVRIAIEVDGYDKRGTGTGMSKEDFEDWSIRETSLVSLGWTVLRFANQRLIKDPDGIVNDLINTLSHTRAILANRPAGAADPASVSRPGTSTRVVRSSTTQTSPSTSGGQIPTATRATSAPSAYASPLSTATVAATTSRLPSTPSVSPARPTTITTSFQPAAQVPTAPVSPQAPSSTPPSRATASGLSPGSIILLVLAALVGAFLMGRSCDNPTSSRHHRSGIGTPVAPGEAEPRGSNRNSNTPPEFRNSGSQGRRSYRPDQHPLGPPPNIGTPLR